MPEGGVIRQPIARPPGTPRTLLTLDVDDHIDPTTREWVTVDENDNLVFLDPDQQQTALFGARFEAWIGAQDLHVDEKRLLLMVGEYFRANAETAESFTLDYFSVVPQFKNVGGLPRAIQAFGNEERLTQVLNSLNQAMFEEPSGNLEQHKEI